MIGLHLGQGLGDAAASGTEVRVGFRSGLVRVLSISLGGAGLVGGAAVLVDFAGRQPAQVMALLSQWGWVWLVVLAAMFLVWDLAKSGIVHLGRLADSVRDSAVAIGKMADKDDRERERMVTETAFILQRVDKMRAEHEDFRDEARARHREIVDLLSTRTRDRGEKSDAG